MGKIYQGGAFILPPEVKPMGGGEWDSAYVITPQDRDTVLADYDGMKDEVAQIDRKFFPISKEGIDRLFKKSDDDGRIMLQVENLSKPREVYAEWLPYNRAIINLSKYDYFIITDDLWSGLNPPTIPNGIKGSLGHIIVAAFGKKTDAQGNDHPCVIINNAMCMLVNDPNTGGGDPPGTSIQIPPL